MLHNQSLEKRGVIQSPNPAAVVTVIAQFNAPILSPCFYVQLHDTRARPSALLNRVITRTSVGDSSQRNEGFLARENVMGLIQPYSNQHCLTRGCDGLNRTL